MNYTETPQYIKDFCEQLQVFTPVGMTKVRVGREKDGGYVCIDELCQQTGQLFSYGVADDISFEVDFVTKYPATTVDCFDHTVDGLPEQHPAIGFHKRGLVFPCDTLDEHTLDYGYPSLRQALKIDVEWAEWSHLGSTDLSVFEQIMVEFHIFPIKFVHTAETPFFSELYRGVYEQVNEATFAMYAEALKNILKTHTIVHMHANNSLTPIQYGEYSIPPLLEVTLVRNDLANFVPFEGVLPVAGLDFSNKPWKPEIENFYPFN